MQIFKKIITSVIILSLLFQILLFFISESITLNIIYKSLFLVRSVQQYISFSSVFLSSYELTNNVNHYSMVIYRQLKMFVQFLDTSKY